MGWVTGANVDGAADSINEALTELKARQSRGGDLSLVQALFATSGGDTPMLATVGNWTKFAAAASTIIAATVTLCGADAASHFKSIAQEMSQSLRELCDNAVVSTNLTHEEMFPQWVFDFVDDQVLVARAGHDLEQINNENLARCSIGTDHVKSEHSDREQDVAHYFFVYHPATDWHAAFNRKIRESPLPGFIGCTNNLDLLGHYLLEFRKVIGPKAIIHILLPSAHMYVIEGVVTIPAELQPIRFQGQIHRSGNPYVHAAIAGLDKSHIQHVGRIIIPNELGAWTKVGAAAGGIGGGIAGAIAGGGGLWLVGAASVVLAGPVAVPFAVAGLCAGVLGGGAAAGTAAGMRITEDAKWKGTGRDSGDKHQKTK